MTQEERVADWVKWFEHQRDREVLRRRGLDLDGHPRFTEEEWARFYRVTDLLLHHLRDGD